MSVLWFLILGSAVTQIKKPFKTTTDTRNPHIWKCLVKQKFKYSAVKHREDKNIETKNSEKSVQATWIVDAG